jgi:hypothetical protein
MLFFKLTNLAKNGEKRKADKIFENPRDKSRQKLKNRKVDKMSAALFPETNFFTIPHRPKFVFSSNQGMFWDDNGPIERKCPVICSTALTTLDCPLPSALFLPIFPVLTPGHAYYADGSAVVVAVVDGVPIIGNSAGLDILQLLPGQDQSGGQAQLIGQVGRDIKADRFVNGSEGLKSKMAYVAFIRNRA